MGEMWRRSATELAGAIASGEVSAVEVVQSHLDRIDAVNPAVNAVTLVLADDVDVGIRRVDGVRQRDGTPWILDITVGEGDDNEWIYRRDPTIRRPWAEAVLISDSGVPYLAPELQLLFKSQGVRPKDDLDVEVVIPLLDNNAREFLRATLPRQHAWLRLT